MVGIVVLSNMVLAYGFVIWEVWVCGFYFYIGGLVGIVAVGGYIWFVVVDVMHLCNHGDLRCERECFFSSIFWFFVISGVIEGYCSVFF